MIDLSPLTGKTVLIAGATGLIGSHMARQALSAGATIVDRIFEYGPPFADFVIHSAGYGQPARFEKTPIETIKVNTDATIRLMQTLKAGGKFLFCSSSEVYSGLYGKVTEDQIGNTTPEHPRACYIEGKRCGEAIVNAYRKAGINAKSARISLAYGPGTRKHDTRALNQFIEQALTRCRIEMKYSGREPRTFCYIDDAVDMLWQVLLYGKQAVYNVGGESRTSMAGVATLIARLTGADLVVPDIEKELIGAPPVVSMDLSRHEKEFGKREYINLEEGLKRTIEYQRGLYEQI